MADSSSPKHPRMTPRLHIFQVLLENSNLCVQSFCLFVLWRLVVREHVLRF